MFTQRDFGSKYCTFYSTECIWDFTGYFDCDCQLQSEVKENQGNGLLQNYQLKKTNNLSLLKHFSLLNLNFMVYFILK